MNEPAIALENATVQHQDGTRAIECVSLKIHQNECVGLVGPNGAGKTSFFLSVTGILPLYSGSVSVFGHRPGNRGFRQELPRLLGLVMQQSDDQIFNPTVLDDVAFGPLNMGLTRAEARDRALEALELVQLQRYENRVPHRLSGGEKRRVALAGILAMHPRFLLLDEPTQDLDPRGRRELLQVLQQLPQGKLIASHDLDFVLQLCPRTILLNQKLIADGITQDILACQNLMEEHGLEVPIRLQK